MGASRAVVARMVANILIDAVIGSLPVVGTLFDAVWKTNKKNVALLDEDVSRHAPSGW